MNQPLPPGPRALLSVFDKSGVVELATALVAKGFELLASGGTAQTLRTAGLPVTAVEAFTAAPEILGGRVKTLHPKIAAGLLADRRLAEHREQLAAHGYVPIELLICNLYPFAQTVAAGKPDEEIVEMIDIGGPTLIRAAAKNFAGGTTVVASPADYPLLQKALAAGEVELPLRRQLAGRALQIIAQYDQQIAAWFATADRDPAAAAPPDFPAQLGNFVRQQPLRYGENPHQTAYLYRESATEAGVAYATQLSGKELSYNNYLDLDAAYRAVFPLADPACAIIKHTNPCGLAAAATQELAFARALAADELAAFGSVIGFNRPLAVTLAQQLLDSKLFVECIIAPGFTDGARRLLGSKVNLRLVIAPAGSPLPTTQLHRIGGGLLLQSSDPGVGDPADWKLVTRRPLEPGWLAELAFAMHAASLLRSNAIAITADRTLLGAGTGQMSRIDSAQIAIGKAGSGSQGGFLGSDAFFPFADCVQVAAAAGIVAIVQPGGSLRDNESIAACDQLGIAMLFTGRRHFRH
jgi:phosphoribosylaminoimidazolecarboxamide formyltransferase/IMP cyclohydrolase